MVRFNLIESKEDNLVLECIGPEVITFKEIIEKLLKLVEKKRLLIPIPLIAANIIATFFQILPKPLITRDQLKLLFYDNIHSNSKKNKYYTTYIDRINWFWKNNSSRERS